MQQYGVKCPSCYKTVLVDIPECSACASKSLEVQPNSVQQLKAVIASKRAMLRDCYQPDELFTRDQVITMLRLLTAV
jgi:hypothetical protein